MWLRKILIAAAVALPLALNPVHASAQGRGPELAATPDAGRTITELNAGLTRKVDGGGALPPGIARRYAPPVTTPPAPEPEPEVQPEPEPEPEPCASMLRMIGFQLFLEDCHGNLTPVAF
jgi:hypothetical protein